MSQMALHNKSWLLQEFSAHNSSLSAIALGKKSGRVMATGGTDGHVNLWAVGNPVHVMNFSGHSSSVESLTFNWLEELLCTGLRSGQLKIWNLGEGKAIRNLTGHKAAVTCLDFHSLGEFVASGSLDCKVKMWDYRRKGCIFTYTGHEGGINALQFSPDGRWMASASDDNTCKIWDLTAGKLLHQFNDHAASVTCLQFNPNELLMATGSKDKTVKVYDVEQFRLVSTSRQQASAVRKVLFSESGHCVYSISQDMFHAYLWEPESRTTDSFIVKWGRPDDVTFSNEQLLSASFFGTVVSNYVVDLSQVQRSTSKMAVAKPFGPQAAAGQFQHDGNVTARPSTSCKEAPGKSTLLLKDAPSDEQSYTPIKHHYTTSPDNQVSVFEPKTTLPRSPSESSPASLPSKVKEVNRHQVKVDVPHQGTSILPHLVGESQLQKNVNQDLPVKDVPFGAPEVKKNAKKQGAVDMFGQMSPSDDIPTRDRNIPEKLDLKDHGHMTGLAQNAVCLSLNESLMSTIVPSQRDEVFGLDMNAFLPVKKEPIVSNKIAVNISMSNTQALAAIENGFESMNVVLTARYKNLEIVRALWSSDDVMTSMNAAVRMKDQALLVDLLGVLNLKGSLWTLDLCQMILPQICELLTSKFESYVTTACTASKVVLQTFGPVIKSNVSSPPTSAVDLSREERYKKCFSCHESLCQIRTILEKYLQKPGKVGSCFRELNILMSTLD